MKDSQLVSARTVVVLLYLLLLAMRPPLLDAQEAAKPSSGHTTQVLAESSKPFHEDWSTPALDRGSLFMRPPTLAATDDIPGAGFIRQRYRVEWRPREVFDLYIIRPRRVAKPPVILTLYSYPDDTESFKSNAWCEMAVNDGYAVIGFVSAVTGHRVRLHSAQAWFVSEMQEALASTAHDAQLILDYLATRSDLDISRVGMFGVGSGGSIAILASAVDARIRAVDLLGPWGDWPSWLAGSEILNDKERPNFLKPEFLAKVTSLDPVQWLPQMKAKSVRIQDIRKNKSMPDESQERLEAAAPGFAIVNEYGNGRAFLREQPAALTLQWIKDQLRSDATLAVSAEKSERVHFYPAVEAPAQSWPNVGTGDAPKTESVSKQKDKKEKDNR